MKRVFFIYQKNRKKIRDLTDKDVIFDLDLKDSQNKKNKGYTYLEDYCEMFSRETGEVRHGYNAEFIQKWAFTQFNNGFDKKNFAQSMVYGDYTLWNSIEFFIQGDIGQLGYELSIPGITFYIDVIEQILSKQRPSEVIIENSKDALNQIIIRVCKKQKIGLVNLGFGIERKSLAIRLVNNSFLIRNYLKSRILFRIIVGKLFCKKAKPQDLLILTNDRYSSKENIGDYYWGPIIKELNRRRFRYKVIECDRIDAWKSLKQVIVRYIPQKYDAQFIGTYYDASTLRNTNGIVRFLKKKFEELDRNAGFKNSFYYKEIKFYDLVRPRLKKVFLTYAYYIADVYAVTQSVVEKEKPKAILVDHEKNYYGRGLITNANLHGIPSFAFEGEAVYKNNTYITQIPIKEILDRKSPLWKPIPDKKFLWGGYSRRWYHEKNYFPESNLKIIGAPKYDFLKELNTKDEQEIREKYSLKKGEKLITVITANWSREEEYLRTVFESLRENKQFKLIIKMHPLDPASNKQMIEKLIKKFEANAVVVIDENCSKLIYASELVITCPSTLVYECILLNKNTLVFGSDIDVEYPYINEGVIKLCKTSLELSKEIRDSLNNKALLVDEPRKKFIRRYLYSDDGMGSRRAVDEIIKYLKSKTNANI
jgi:hypothetical protein